MTSVARRVTFGRPHHTPHVNRRFLMRLRQKIKPFLAQAPRPHRQDPRGVLRAVAVTKGGGLSEGQAGTIQMAMLKNGTPPGARNRDPGGRQGGSFRHDRRVRRSDLPFMAAPDEKNHKISVHIFRRSKDTKGQ